MTETLTDEQRSLSRRYFAYEALSNLWFVSAIWLYLYRLFITDQQVGFLDGFAFAAGLIAEVPSGALADRFGRDKLVKIGQFLTGTGLLIQAFGSSFVPFFVGQAIVMVGVSFVSGAEEALFFGRLNFDRKSTMWRKLVTRASQFGLAASLFAIVIGGWLHTINPRIPWVLNGLAFLATVALIWTLKDMRPKKERGTFGLEIREYPSHIREGFLEFRTSQFFLYVPFIIAVQGLFYTAGWGILRIILLDRFHFDAFFGSIVVASTSLITIGTLWFMHRYADHMSERHVLASIGALAASSLLLSLADIGAWGYIVMLILYAGEHTLAPFMSEVLNNRATEERRATVLSVASFLKALPYVILAPIIGYLSTQNKLEYFLIFWALLIVVAVLLYLYLKKKDTFVDMVHAPIETEKQMPG